jgi:hypothetical protein
VAETRHAVILTAQPDWRLGPCPPTSQDDSDVVPGRTPRYQGDTHTHTHTERERERERAIWGFEHRSEKPLQVRNGDLQHLAFDLAMGTPNVAVGAILQCTHSRSPPLFFLCPQQSGAKPARTHAGTHGESTAENPHRQPPSGAYEDKCIHIAIYMRPRVVTQDRQPWLGARTHALTAHTHTRTV